MKNRLKLFVAGCIALFLSSCLNSGDQDYDIPTDCQIMTFSVSHDSILGGELDTVKFVIDQVNGRIFNPDSLPFGTEVGKVVCTVTSATGTYSIEVTQEALPDSTFYWNKEDSLDFSKPVKFVTAAYDGLTKKTYIAEVNIHQVVPDSMSWELYGSDVLGFSAKERKVIVRGDEDGEYYYMYAEDKSGEYSLHVSSVSDARSWTALALSGLPTGEVSLSQITEYEGALYVPTTKGALLCSEDGQSWAAVDQPNDVKALLGAVTEVSDGMLHQSSFLSAIVNDEGVLRFAYLNTDKGWSVGDDVPDGFPVSGFGTLASYSSGSKQNSLTVVAGRDKDGALLNSAWATMNGGQWALLTDMESDYFDEREGVMLSAYDGKFCLIGGIDDAGEARKDLYFSTDRGVTWALSDSLAVMPDDYVARGFASVAVDKDDFMLIFGGKEAGSAVDMDQIWRGRINRLGFKD